MVVIQFGIGSLGTVSMDREKHKKYLGLSDLFGTAQISALLGTTHIPRKVLCLQAVGRG